MDITILLSIIEIVYLIRCAVISGEKLKQLILLAISIWITFFCLQADAAISAASVFDIRSTATAGNVNGCFFVTGAAGTDFSKQDTSQFNGTDLASTVGTTNPCVVTSAGHNFVSTDVGNGLHINSGTNWTAGWYQIVSVAGNAATLDRACGSSASLSAGTWHLGGACSLGTGTDQTVFQNCTNASGGQIFYIKNGTYSPSATINFSANTGGAQQPCQIIGYNSTQGDVPTAAQRPIISMGTAPIIGADNWSYYNFIINGSATVTGVFQPARWSKIINMKVVNSTTTTGIAAINNGNFSTMINSEVVSYRGIGYNCGNSCNLFYNYIHDSDIGFQFTATGQVNTSTLIGNLFIGMGSVAAKFTAAATEPVFMFGNTFYGGEANKTGTGISIATGFTNFFALNNIFYGFSTGVSHADSQTMTYFDYNDFNNNTTARTNIAAGANDITTSPQFANVSQITDTGASTSSATLTANTATFNGKVTDNQDFCLITSTTGTTGQYAITGHSNTTLTLSPSPGTGSSVAYQVIYNRNFAVGPNMNAKGFPGTTTGFPGGTVTGYTDLGALQRRMGYPRGR